ncbi:unnamed protein product [Dicrocoelium dendriticum]|nr:unnamed protein product [Dicrocoelium dendriticum]
MPDIRLWLILLSVALTFSKRGRSATARREVQVDTNFLLRGYVGCLFQNVCFSGEICLKDGLFGRCIDYRANPIKKERLSWEQLLKLGSVLVLLKNNVLDWEDVRVQCIVRTVLHYGTKLHEDPEEMCGLRVPDHDFTNPPKYAIIRKRNSAYGGNMTNAFLFDEPVFKFIQESDNALKQDEEIPSIGLSTNNQDVVKFVGSKRNGNAYIKKLDRSEDRYERQLSFGRRGFSIAFDPISLRKFDRTQRKTGSALPFLREEVSYSDGLPKRRYLLNLPYDLKPPTPPTRSWVWTKFLRRSLDAYEAEQFLRELSNRLDLTSPISNYFLDRTGNVLYFQVPEATGVSAESVLLALKQGKGNFDGYETEDVGFGRGAPVYRAAGHTEAPKRLQMSLVVCLAIVGFVFILSVIYAIHVGCNRFRLHEAENDAQRRTLLSSEQLNSSWRTEKLKHTGNNLLEKIKPFVRLKTDNRSMLGNEGPRQTRAQSCFEDNNAITAAPTSTSSTSSLSSKRTTVTYPPNDLVDEQKSTPLACKKFPVFSTSSWSSEPVSCGIDVNTGHTILTYMERYLDDEGHLTADWNAVSAYESEEATPCEDARKPENKMKNRTGAPIPFELSHVRLRNSQNEYINASLLYDHSPRNPIYIATPGPMVETLADFWEMIWEQCCVVLVNLERPSEIKRPNMQENAEDCSVTYWPDEGTKVYGTFEVHLVSEHSWCEDYVVRSLYLKNLESSETRTVTQFHYLTWDDETLKLKTKSLLEFRRKVNKSFRGMMSPIVVHCNDGAGRTGTYILLDMILNRVTKGIKEMNIAASLEHLRDQRYGMVRKKEQYEFVFHAVAQEVDAMLKTNEQTE